MSAIYPTAYALLFHGGIHGGNVCDKVIDGRVTTRGSGIGWYLFIATLRTFKRTGAELAQAAQSSALGGPAQDGWRPQPLPDQRPAPEESIYGRTARAGDGYGAEPAAAL